MDSKKAGVKPSFGPKGSSSDGSSSGPSIEQLSHDMANAQVNPPEEGEWQVIGKKSKNRAGSSTPAPKAWAQQEGLPGKVPGSTIGAGRASGNNWAQAGKGGATRSSGNSWANPASRGGAGRASGNWGQPVGSRRPVGGGSTNQQPLPKAWGSASMAPPPLEHGWKSGEKSAAPHDSESDVVYNQHDNVSDADTDDDEIVDDSDDDLSDGFDSDTSQKSHESRKKNRWLKGFFESLDKLTVDELNESSRQWHCPACQNGPGAIDWYTGLQPLITHAKTKGSQRAKLHRELAKLLDEELRQRGTSAIPAGEAFGKWKGLFETTTDHEIVWPPFVVVMNTLLDKDENDKWIGMGNQELLEYFSTYAAVKARHSYGPHGHRGMSLLIFEPNAMGYLEAERLHKHFAEQGTDKDAWVRRPVLFYPGGKRQLYGYLAGKDDMEVFNKHCQGKTRLKYEMKSYQEMVVIPMKQMSEDNQKLVWLKNKVVKQERQSKALEETFDRVSQKLRETMEENRIVRLRTKRQYEENKEEMDYQENFFKEQMDKVQKDIEEKERKYEILLQEERAKANQTEVKSGTNEEQSRRKQEILRFIDSQEKGVEEFVAERDKLVCEHENKKTELRRKYKKEEVELEAAFDLALTKLMEKFAPSAFKTSSSSS